MRCERCGSKGGVIVSYFNTQTICLPCRTIEQQHPDYERAHAAEIAACKRGDYNFPGVGLPAGYAEWARERAAVSA